MTDAKDKLKDETKAALEAGITELKEALAAEDTDKIKEKTDELQKKVHEFSQELYQGAGADSAEAPSDDAQPDNAEASSKDDDNVVDADYEEVEDNKK